MTDQGGVPFGSPVPGGPIPPGAPAPPAASWPPLPPGPPPRGRGIPVGSCLMALFLIGSLGLNAVLLVMLLGSLGAGGLQADGIIERQVEAPKNSSTKQKIVVIPVHGVIASGQTSLFGSTGDMVEKIIQDLRRVGKDRDVVAVILDVDSPGGGITDCDRIHHEITKLRAENKSLKFVSFMRDVAASGGYYVSAPCDRIVASHTTITGSIGVIMTFMNLQGLFEKIGVREEVIKSGDHKDIGSMARPMTDEEREMLQGMLMEMYDRFVQVVASGRKMDEKKVRELADGRIYSAMQARANGLVDLLGHFEDAVNEARALAGVADAAVVQYARPPTLADVLRGEVRAPTPEAAVAASLERLTARRDGFYYLWTAGKSR